jgi:hypothetical protein
MKEMVENEKKVVAAKKSIKDMKKTLKRRKKVRAKRVAKRANKKLVNSVDLGENNKVIENEEKNEVVKTSVENVQLTVPKNRDFSNDLIVYLEEWENRKSGNNWKFNKVLQAWALENCLESSKIEFELFSKLVPYIETVQGSALLRLLTKCNEVVLTKVKSDEDKTSADNEESKLSASRLKRALSIIKLFKK